jgi:hypothetical protein
MRALGGSRTIRITNTSSTTEPTSADTGIKSPGKPIPEMSPRRVQIDLNDDDFTHHVINAPDDAAGVAGFRVGTLRELQRMSDELQRMSADVEQLSALLEKYRSPLYVLGHREVVVLEVFLSLASLWAAFVLWHDPMLFESFPAAFRLVQAFEGNEQIWGAFAFVAAVTKLIGIIACVTRDPTWGRVVRYIGLAMSGVFWTVMGGGVMLGNPNTLFGFNSLLMGAFSWWSLLRLAK